MNYREYLRFDSRVFAAAAAGSGLIAAQALRLAGDRTRSFRTLAALHRSAYSSWTTRAAERALATEFEAASGGRENILDRHLQDLQPAPGTEAFFKDPGRLLGTRLIVLKSPSGAERGLLLFDYTPLFPLLPRLFHADRIMERYHLVLEPSWTGYCDLDLVSATRYAHPVFVQAVEPYDREFLERLGGRFVVVPIAANWWIDHRVIRPMADVKKDTDLIMIASWARFKRHDRVFAALERLKARGIRLRSILIGYPNGLTKEDVLELARRRHVDDQIELHESLPPEEVNRQLNRSRVNIVWSRREGVNRAIIEGMLAGLPGLLRRGFNYGYHYPYINSETGVYAGEDDLPERLLGLVECADAMRPREWVLRHMSVDQALDQIGITIQAWSEGARQPWTPVLAKKVGFLNAMRYWDEADRQRFEPDYQFLRSQVRTHGSA